MMNKSERPRNKNKLIMSGERIKREEVAPNGEVGKRGHERRSVGEIIGGGREGGAGGGGVGEKKGVVLESCSTKSP